MPKTGSSSIQHYIKSLDLGGVEIFETKAYPHELPPNQRFRNHIRTSDLKREVINFDQYFKFTFVRNPYDTAVSWVYYYLRKSKINLYKHSFKELILKCPEWIWEPQYKFIYDGRSYKTPYPTGYYCKDALPTKNPLERL